MLKVSGVVGGPCGCELHLCHCCRMFAQPEEVCTTCTFAHSAEFLHNLRGFCTTCTFAHSAECLHNLVQPAQPAECLHNLRGGFVQPAATSAEYLHNLAQPCTTCTTCQVFAQPEEGFVQQLQLVQNICTTLYNLHIVQNDCTT